MCCPDPYILPTLDMVGGTSKELAFPSFLRDTKLPFDLSACKAEFSIIDFLHREGTPVFTKEMTISTQVIDGATVANVLKVKLSPADTLSLQGKYLYQITIVDTDSDMAENPQGIIYIFKNTNASFIQQHSS